MIHTFEGVLSGRFAKCDLFCFEICKRIKKLKSVTSMSMISQFQHAFFLILALCIFSSVLSLSTHMVILRVSFGVCLSSVR